MSWKRSQSKSQPKKEIEYSQPSVNLRTIGIVIGIAVLILPVLIMSLRAAQFINEDYALMIIGGLVVLVVVVITTICWSGVVLAYSRLRNREDAADDRRELDMMRAVAAMSKTPSITVKTPQQQALPGLPNYGATYPGVGGMQTGPQQPVPHIIDYHEPTELA